jgi:hypothetical protein
MQARGELRAFHVVVGVLLLIPFAAGIFGGFGGLESLARVMQADPQVTVGPALGNHLRAVCWAFFTLGVTVVWTLRSPVQRASGFRVIVGCLVLAGLARLTGWFVDGTPGAVPAAIMAIELLGLPLILLWHARLVRRLAR